MVVALQIRDVPENVRDTLAEQARRRGQSLQAYLLMLVKTEAQRRSRNMELLARFEDRADGHEVQPGETAEQVRAARADREAGLAGDQ